MNSKYWRLQGAEADLTIFWVVIEIRVWQYQILVFMSKSGKNHRLMDLEYNETLRLLITTMGGVLVVVVLEVPWAFFTT